MASPRKQAPAYDFPATIYRRDGRTYAVNDELFAIAEGATADEAIERLHDDIETRRMLFAAAGAETPQQKVGRYVPFLVKTAAVTLACIVVIVTADLIVARALVDFPRRAASIALATVDELGQLSQWVSDERKREIGRSLRLLIENLQPVVEEVRPSLLGTQRPPGGTTDSPAQ